jgi:uncharacterized damage-inducible protein DinB
MLLWQAYLKDIVFSFDKHKQMAEKGLEQLPDEAFFRTPGEHCNSVAAIVKHVAGNLKSRWTDFLTTDGDKPWRDRDNEFVIGSQDSRERLLDAWRQAWQTLFDALAALGEADLLKQVTIRGEGHTVLQAIDRSLTHTAYHVGQILYVARLVKQDGWKWITIPPGQSQQHAAQGGRYLK